MSLGHRREVLKAGAALALLPLLHAWSARAVGGVGEPIAPPAGQMVFRRTVVRHLPGDETLTVERSFAVEFIRAGDGFRLEGSQIAAQVAAPPSLASFAALEESRVERGPFPIALDAAGQIVDGELCQPSPQAMAALTTLRTSLAGQENELARLTEALHQAGPQLVAVLPRDLFSPIDAERDERRTIPLPWGGSGEVESLFSAFRDPDSGLMRFARREIVTRLGDSERRSREMWALETA